MQQKPSRQATNPTLQHMQMAPPNRVSLAFLVALAVVAGAALQPASGTRDGAGAVTNKAEQGDSSSSSSSQPSAGGGGGRWPFPALPPLPSFHCIPGVPQVPWLPPCNNGTHGNGGGTWPFPRPQPRPLPPLPSFPCIPGVPQVPWLPPCNNATHGHGGGAWPFPRPQPRPLPPMPPAPPQPAECGTPLAAMMPCADFLTKTGVTAPPAACCDGLKAVVKDAPVCMCHVVNRDFSKLLPAPMLRLRMMMLPRVCGAAMPFGTLRQCIRGPVPPMKPPSSP